MIDDNVGDLALRSVNLRRHAVVLTRAPDEVTVSDLRKANVVLIDYRIAHWPGREKVTSISLQPSNGVALGAVLRSYADEHIPEKRRAFAIHSGVLHDLGGGLPARSREHAIARTLNLEWVFPKQGDPDAPPLENQVAVLAKAVKALPRTWPETPKRASDVLSKLLKTPLQVSWGARAAADVESSHPPIHAWATATNGMAFIRWLLHHILPYPSFLWDERYLAARLHVSAESLRRVLAGETKARRTLAPFRYQGVLEDFLGTRWWRTGVEQLLWNWTSGNPFNVDAVREAARTRISTDLDHLALMRPVVCVDPQSFRPTDRVVDAADAVEIRPDDWPPYAEQAWVPATEVAGEEGLIALVVPQDRDRAEGPA